MKLRNKKTGVIGDFDIECYRQRGDFVKVVANDVPYYEIKKECGNLYYYYTLAEFNEEWEDYKPTDPLIKDQAIRKAVRAWAEANNSTKMVFDGYHLASDEHGNDIEFSNSWAEYVKHGEWYTIAELCGEEEECES